MKKSNIKKRQSKKFNISLKKVQKQLINIVKKPFNLIHLKKKKHMFVILNDFMGRAIKKGLVLKDIKTALLIKGWPKEFITKYAKEYYHLYEKKEKELAKKLKIKSKEIRSNRPHIVAKYIEELNEELRHNKDFIQKVIPQKWVMQDKSKGIFLKKYPTGLSKREKKLYESKDMGFMQAQILDLEKDISGNKNFLQKVLPQKWVSNKSKSEELLLKEINTQLSQREEKSYQKRGMDLFASEIAELEKEIDKLDRKTNG